MKKLSITLITLLFAVVGQAQNICDVSIKGQFLQLYNCSGNYSGTKTLFDGDVLCDFSESLIVIKSGSNNFTVYDDKFNIVSSKILFDGDVVKNVIGNNIIVRDTNGLVIIYDKKFNRVGSHFE